MNGPASSCGRRSAARGAKIHTRVCRAISQSRMLPAPGSWACLEGCDCTRHLHRCQPHSRRWGPQEDRQKRLLSCWLCGERTGVFFLFGGKVECDPVLSQPAPRREKPRRPAKPGTCHEWSRVSTKQPPCVWKEVIAWGLWSLSRSFHFKHHHASMFCFGSRSLEKSWLCILFRGSQELLKWRG